MTALGRHTPNPCCIIRDNCGKPIYFCDRQHRSQSVDAMRFDVACRLLSAPAQRRRVLSALTALAFSAGAILLSPPELGLSKDRRRRRKLRHKRRHNSGGNSAKGCRRKSVSRICSGRCGAVKNRKSCGKSIDCSQVCSEIGSTCCDGACQTVDQLQATCPSDRTTGFLTFDDGAMRCAATDVAACSCLGGVYRACAPGTVCVQTGASILCDFPSG